MGELIKISKDSSTPRIACPHCGQPNLIDITPFKEDVSKILRDRCTSCRGEIFVAILLLGHTKLDLLLLLIRKVISVITSPHKIIG